MTASEAKKLADVRIQEKKKEQLDKEVKERQARNKYDESFKLNEFPKVMKNIYAAIKRSASCGSKLYEYDSAYSGNINRDIELDLTNHGFSVNGSRYSYESNMGDFNAPCMVIESGYTITIRW